MSPAFPSWIVTCEHGGNEVPPEYRSWFDSVHAARLLRSHRGFDPGAWEASLQFAEHLHRGPDPDATRATSPGNENLSIHFGFGGAWIASRTTRLLVDLNRSLGSQDLFSAFACNQSFQIRQQLLQDWYCPYRAAVERAISSRIADCGQVIHLSIHTFTPRIQRRWRRFEVGLLFDPARKLESRICLDWQRQIHQNTPKLRVRLNEPYQGIDDGFTESLRQQHEDDRYAGIEVEINNRFFKRGIDAQGAIVAKLLGALPLGW